MPRVPLPLAVSTLTARRFLRQAVGLERRLPGVVDVLDHHGYVQIDPINVCGRMHDLILRNRVNGYREGDLMRVLHGDGVPLTVDDRVAFEQHVPGSAVLVAFPLDAWPHLHHAMLQRSRRSGAWSGRLTPREKTLADVLLTEIAARGPLGSADFADQRKVRRVWGAAKLVKATLQKLFFHGRLLIAQRVNHRRRYDLPERVLPARLLAQRAPDPAETARWLVRLKLRQRRLVPLKRDELPLVADDVQRITLTDVAGANPCPALYCLREDLPLLDAAAAETSARRHVDAAGGHTDRPTPADIHLLAPLDPLIYDRRLTAALWSFDYTWEVYTPPAKRVRGYYALPILARDDLVGHVDLRANRIEHRLEIRSRRVRRGHPLAPVLREFAQWLGLRA